MENEMTRSYALNLVGWKRLDAKLGIVVNHRSGIRPVADALG